MCQEFNKYWIKNQKSAYEMVKEFVDEQGIKIKENNMEDRNKTVAELIADLQNQLNRANNHIDELAEENNKLTCDNILLKEDSLIANKRIDKLVKENNKLIRENMILDEDNIRVNNKYCEYNQAAQDAWNENNKIKKEIEKLKNENEYLEGVVDWVMSENDDMSKEITKWHNKYTKEKAKNDELSKNITKWYNKYTKEKAKHDKATKKIDELKKHQKDEAVAYALKTAINSVYGLASASYSLAWSDKRRHDRIDSLLYSYWGLKEYYQEAKCNKNEANDVKE